MIWNVKSGKLIRRFEADSSIVNCVQVFICLLLLIQSNPVDFRIATSGIDSIVHIFEPGYVSKDAFEDLSIYIERNQNGDSSSFTDFINGDELQRIFQILLGHANTDSDDDDDAFNYFIPYRENEDQ